MAHCRIVKMYRESIYLDILWTTKILRSKNINDIHPRFKGGRPGAQTTLIVTSKEGKFYKGNSPLEGVSRVYVLADQWDCEEYDSKQ